MTSLPRVQVTTRRFARHSWQAARRSRFGTWDRPWSLHQGPRGHISGTYAGGNERCVGSFVLDGIVYHSYPGGTDATGPDVWKRFGPPSRGHGGDQMQIKIATSGFRAVNLAESQGQSLLSA